MDIRPITTDQDYEEALAEIKRLWSAEAGSADGQKLEVLAMLAQKYERAREPLPKADPIEAIKFRMDQAGLTRRDLLPNLWDDSSNLRGLQRQAFPDLGDGTKAPLRPRHPPRLARRSEGKEGETDHSTPRQTSRQAAAPIWPSRLTGTDRASTILGRIAAPHPHRGTPVKPELTPAQHNALAVARVERAHCIRLHALPCASTS